MHAFAKIDTAQTWCSTREKSKPLTSLRIGDWRRCFQQIDQLAGLWVFLDLEFISCFTTQGGVQDGETK